MLDLLLRGAALGGIALITAILLGHGRSRGALAVTALGLCVSCYLLVSAPVPVPPVLRPILIAGASAVPLTLTIVATEQLTDDPPQRRPLLLLALLVTVTAAGAPFWPLIQMLRGGLAIVLYIGLIVLALITDRDDLVPSRRRFRRGFLASLGLLGLIVSLIEASGMDNDLPEWMYPVQAAAILSLVLLFGIWALSPARPLQPDRAEPPVKHKDVLVTQVEQAMADGIWQTEGLTIGAMAATLQVPEHQLRTTINGAMGYRNFSTFINSARIAAARDMLDDPAKSRTTILEIAHEVGFASLGPFNKAFRAQTGCSPRQYRSKF